MSSHSLPSHRASHLPRRVYLPVFPLFWLAGSLILLSPLRAPEDWESSKPEVERQEIIESMRRTELKWARRCLVALSLFTLVVISTVLSVFLIMRS